VDTAPAVLACRADRVVVQRNEGAVHDPRVGAVVPGGGASAGTGTR
jgi:hypothetical protein